MEPGPDPRAARVASPDGQQRVDVARRVLFCPERELDGRLRLEQCDHRLLVAFGTERVERERELLVDIFNRALQFRARQRSVAVATVAARPLDAEPAVPAVSEPRRR